MFYNNKNIQHNIDMITKYTAGHCKSKSFAKYMQEYILNILYEMSHMIYMDYFADKDSESKEVKQEKELFDVVFKDLSYLMSLLISFIIEDVKDEDQFDTFRVKFYSDISKIVKLIKE